MEDSSSGALDELSLFPSAWKFVWVQVSFDLVSIKGWGGGVQVSQFGFVAVTCAVSPSVFVDIRFTIVIIMNKFVSYRIFFVDGFCSTWNLMEKNWQTWGLLFIFSDCRHSFACFLLRWSYSPSWRLCLLNHPVNMDNTNNNINKSSTLPLPTPATNNLPPRPITTVEMMAAAMSMMHY